MTKKFYIPIVLSVFVLSGCKKPPVACMELSSNNVSVGTTVEFTSCSKKHSAKSGSLPVQQVRLKTAKVGATHTLQIHLLYPEITR